METTPRSRWRTFLRRTRTLLVIVLAFATLQQVCGPLRVAAARDDLLELKRPRGIGDDMLVLADVAQKARRQVTTFVNHVLLKHLPNDRAALVSAALSEGQWTHDFPITVELARQLGLPVSTGMPRLIYELMDLHPQSGQGRPSVMYVPIRHASADAGREDPGGATGDGVQ